MENLWAPWRLKYVAGDKKADGCVFCEFPKRNNDEDDRILYRGKYSFIIMNAFPYSNGHLLVVPYKHTGSILDLDNEETSEMMQSIQKCCKVLDVVCRPDGVNVGMNIGTAAGAGIADHIHMHAVPRWNGDTNFMPVFADIKVIPEDLDTTYKKLKIEFDRLED